MQGAGGLRCGGHHRGGFEGLQGVQNHVRRVLDTALPLQFPQLVQGRVHSCLNILQKQEKGGGEANVGRSPQGSYFNTTGQIMEKPTAMRCPDYFTWPKSSNI